MIFSARSGDRAYKFLKKYVGCRPRARTRRNFEIAGGLMDESFASIYRIMTEEKLRLPWIGTARLSRRSGWAKPDRAVREIIPRIGFGLRRSRTSASLVEPRERPTLKPRRERPA